MFADRESDDLPLFARADPDFCSEIKRRFESGCLAKLRRSSDLIAKAIATKNEDLDFLGL